MPRRDGGKGLRVGKALSLSVHVREMGPRRPILLPQARSPLTALPRTGTGQAGRREAEPRGPKPGPALPRVGRSQWTVTDRQLVPFHWRQAEHVGVFSSIRFIKGFDVDGEFLHERASKPAGEGNHPSGPAFGGGGRGASWARACWTPLGRREGSHVGPRSEGKEAGVVAETHLSRPPPGPSPCPQNSQGQAWGREQWV